VLIVPWFPMARCALAHRTSKL